MRVWHKWRFSRDFVTSVGHLLFRIANDALSSIHGRCASPAFKVMNRNNVRRRACRHRHGDIPQAAERSSAQLSAVTVVNLISAFHLRSDLWSLVISLDKDNGPAATLKTYACPHTSYSLSRPIVSSPDPPPFSFAPSSNPSLRQIVKSQARPSSRRCRGCKSCEVSIEQGRGADLQEVQRCIIYRSQSRGGTLLEQQSTR